jgi:hypothetical protein
LIAKADSPSHSVEEPAQFAAVRICSADEMPSASSCATAEVMNERNARYPLGSSGVAEKSGTRPECRTRRPDASALMQINGRGSAVRYGFKRGVSLVQVRHTPERLAETWMAYLCS